MKKLLLVLLGFATLSLTSCLDIFENITLNNDGSGTYEVKMDMAKGIKIMQDMIGGGGQSSKKKKEKMDSSFSYKSIVDTASELSAEEKKVYGKGICHIKVDEENAVAFVEMKFPFASKNEFATLQNVMHSQNGGVNMFDVIDRIMSKMKDAPPIDQREKDELPIGSLSYVLTDNSISCKAKVNNNADKKNDVIDDIPKELLGMMKMNMKLTINLPKPLTSIDNKTAAISSDKKVVIISKELTLGETLKGVDYNFNINF